jgi:hypothetical protein
MVHPGVITIAPKPLLPELPELPGEFTLQEAVRHIMPSANTITAIERSEGKDLRPTAHAFVSLDFFMRFSFCCNFCAARI